MDDETKKANGRTGRHADGKWKKGVSGNPKGMTKHIGHVRELARQHTDKAIERLVAILNDDKAPAASHIAAAEAILNRGYGRPAQSSDVTIRKASVEAMSDEELQAIAAGADGDDVPEIVDDDEARH